MAAWDGRVSDGGAAAWWKPGEGGQGELGVSGG